MKKPKTATTWRRHAAMAGYLFILPNVLGFLVFTSLPVLASLVLSMCKWDLLTPPKWVGLDNFRTLLADVDFWKVPWSAPYEHGYFFNTAVLMMAIPVSIFLSLFLATMLNQKLRGMVLYRTLFFLPSITAGIGTMLLWMWLLNPEFGMLNRGLGCIYDVLAWFPGLAGWDWAPWTEVRPVWLQSAEWAKPALITMGLWGSMGGMNMILYLAALQGVPPALYEAAKIDGAGAWQRFWKITWPMVSPTTFFIFVMGIIGGFQGGFQQAHIMTDGGPAGSTTTIGFYIYRNAYQWFKMGYAASIAWFLFMIVLALTIFNWRVSQRLVHYG
ncbi:MAG: sugar ABC transporter permease [Phycisphaerae bacterium]|nr:sugar ABC transporter permease [Phycisphaerae bacterium]